MIKNEQQLIKITKDIYDVSGYNKTYKEEVDQLIKDFNNAMNTLKQGYKGSQTANINIFNEQMSKQLLRLRELFNIAELYALEIYNTFNEKDQYYANIFESHKIGG